LVEKPQALYTWVELEPLVALLSFSPEIRVLPLPVGTGRPPPRPPLSLKSFESDHEIMQNGIICLNLVKKM
jgi:hypothetical protein